MFTSDKVINIPGAIEDRDDSIGIANSDDEKGVPAAPARHMSTSKFFYNLPRENARLRDMLSKSEFENRLMQSRINFLEIRRSEPRQVDLKVWFCAAASITLIAFLFLAFYITKPDNCSNKVSNSLTPGGLGV